MFRRLGLIGSDFRRGLEDQVDTVVYESGRAKGVGGVDVPFVTVYSRHDPGGDVDGGYMWVERAGVDSCAFVLYRELGGVVECGLLRCWHTPTSSFKNRAFTGSFDKPDLEPVEVCREEVREESGYDVGLERVKAVCELEVSHNTNEVVHLYLVDVTGLECLGLEPENAFEENVEVVWCRSGDVRGMSSDWKAWLLADSVGCC